MPLRVRFRHAASQRVLDLPDRGMASPLVIGRGDDVDLRLPFDPVAPQHAALYLKDGVWVIQSISGVVTLGGRTLSSPAKLRSGDVIGLGAEGSAPTLEIEPKDAEPASAGGPAGSGPPRPQPAPAPAPAAARARPQSPAAHAPGVEQTPAPLPADGDGAAGDDTIEWDPQTPLPETTSFYVPKSRKTPIVGILAAVLLGGGLLVAAGIIAYHKARQPSVIIVRQDAGPLPAGLSAPATRKKTLFDVNGDQPSQAGPQNTVPIASAPAAHPAAQPNAGPADSAVATADHVASPSPTKEEALPDPDDADWNEIRSAHVNVRHQGVAILKFDEYRREHPGKFTDLLDRYTDEAINWLYWQRVAQLWARQDDQTAELRQKTRDIQNQPPGEFHERLVKERAELQARADQTRQLLTDEMGYRGDVPPDLESPRVLKQLAGSRDSAKFAAFTKRVLRYVRNNHGGVWWDGE